MKRIIFCLFLLYAGNALAQDVFVEVAGQGSALYGNQTGYAYGPSIALGMGNDYMSLALTGSYLRHQSAQEYAPGIGTSSQGSIWTAGICARFNVSPLVGGRSDSRFKVFLSGGIGYYQSLDWRLVSDQTGEYSEYLLQGQKFLPAGLYGNLGLRLSYDLPRSKLSIFGKGFVGYLRNDITRPEPDIPVSGSISRGTMLGGIDIGMAYHFNKDPGRQGTWKKSTKNKWKPSKRGVKPRF